MASLWRCGFELNSTAELNTSTTGFTISSTTVRSGSYAGRITSLVSGTTRHFGWQFATTDQTGPIYVRWYYRVATLPSAENTIFRIQSSASVNRVKMTLDNSGVLRLYDDVGQINTGGPNSNGTSNAISTNTWYCIEVKFDRTGGTGASVLSARIATETGVPADFAAASNRTFGSGIRDCFWGANMQSEAQTVGDFFFDDIAINDGSGSYQTSYPGKGRIVHLHPSGAGTAANWTRGGTDSGANWDQVNEVTANDATDYISSNTLNQADSYALDDTPSGIHAYDRINYVAVGFRFNGAGASANASVAGAITCGGVTDQTATIAATNTTWTYNSTGTPKSYRVLNNSSNYEVPGTSNPYTKADLDAAEIGIQCMATSTNAVQVSMLYLLVEYDDTLIYNATKGALAYGEQSPTNGEKSLGYSLFTNGSGGTPGVSGDANWGKLALVTGSEGRAPVIDFGNSVARSFTLTRDVYGTGVGSTTLKIRGSDTAFAADDATPSWNTYTAPVTLSYRYVQIEVVGA